MCCFSFVFNFFHLILLFTLRAQLLYLFILYFIYFFAHFDDANMYEVKTVQKTTPSNYTIHRDV